MRAQEEILGETPLPLFLLKCRSDFKFFAEKCLQETSTGHKIKIYPFQMKWIEQAEKHRKIIIESGTGSSKTELMGAMYVIWKMFTGKNLRILLVSKTMEQSSSNLLSRIKRYIEENGFLKELFIPEDYKDSWNATEIKTKNGCWVKNVPFNLNIRGYRGNLIVCDEIDSYEDTNIFFEHVLSRLFPDGQLIGISTPVGPTKIIGQLKEKYNAGILKGWSFIKTPYLVDKEGKPAKINNREDIWLYESIWPEMWSLQKLYERWGDEGKSNWMRNIMCENLGEIDDAIFPIKHIIDSFDYKRGFSEEVDQNNMYFISADLAISDGPRADFDAYVVVEKKGDLFIIKKIETYRGLDTIPKINRIDELYNIYYSSMGTYIIVDPSLVGIDVIRGLQARGLPVVASTFQPEARKKLYRTLSNVLASKRIIIPRNPDADDECVRYSEELKDQLTGFKRSKSKSGNEIIDSKAAHDDIAASLAMNINEAIQHVDMDCLPVSG